MTDDQINTGRIWAKTCVVCGEVFASSHPRGVLCGEECRVQRHRIMCRAKMRRWRQKNPERARAYSRSYIPTVEGWENHKAYCREYMRNRRALNMTLAKTRLLAQAAVEILGQEKVDELFGNL